MFAVTLTVLSCDGKQQHDQVSNIDTIPELVLQIKKCSKLYTTMRGSGSVTSILSPRLATLSRVKEEKST